MADTRQRAQNTDSRRTARPRRPSSAVRWYAAAMGALATGLSLWLGAGQSIWFDEAYTLLVVQHSVPEIISLTAVDVHPPLFYLLLKAWVAVFGTGIIALRLLPALLTGLAVITAFALLRRLFSTSIAAWALPVFALNPLLLRYGFEVRMYALATFISLLATLLLVRALQTGRRRDWALYGLLVLAGIYTIYVSAFIWLAHGIWLLTRWWMRDRAPLFRQPWVWTYAASLLLFAPWLVIAIRQSGSGSLAGNGKAVTIETLAAALPMITAYTPSWVTGPLLTSLLAAVGVLIAVVSLKVPHDAREHEGITLLLAAVLVPMIVHVVNSLMPDSNQLFHVRYLLLPVAYAALLVGALAAMALAQGTISSVRAGAALLICMLTMAGMGVYRLQLYGNFNYDTMSEQPISQARASIRCDDQTTVLADNAFDYITISYHFADCDVRFFSADPVEYLGGYAPVADSPARVASTAQIDAPNVVVVRGSDNALSLTDDGYELTDSQQFGGLTLDHYTRAAD